MNPPDPQAPDAERPQVQQIHVVPMEVYFQCPGCGAALDGYLSDPRGIGEICCEECGLEFDIATDASVVID